MVLRWYPFFSVRVFLNFRTKSGWRYWHWIRRGWHKISSYHEWFCKRDFLKYSLQQILCGNWMCLCSWIFLSLMDVVALWWVAINREIYQCLMVSNISWLSSVSFWSNADAIWKEFVLPIRDCLSRFLVNTSLTSCTYNKMRTHMQRKRSYEGIGTYHALHSEYYGHF